MLSSYVVCRLFPTRRHAHSTGTFSGAKIENGDNLLTFGSTERMQHIILFTFQGKTLSTHAHERTRLTFQGNDQLSTHAHERTRLIFKASISRQSTALVSRSGQ